MQLKKIAFLLRFVIMEPYMKITLEQTQTKIVPILKAAGVSFAGIFGSYARGEAKPESDLDVLVKFSSRKTLLEFIRLERRLSEMLGVKVDLVTEEFLSPYIRPNVLRDLKVLYA